MGLRLAGRLFAPHAHLHLSQIAHFYFWTIPAPKTLLIPPKLPFTVSFSPDFPSQTVMCLQAGGGHRDPLPGLQTDLTPGVSSILLDVAEYTGGQGGEQGGPCDRASPQAWAVGSCAGHCYSPGRPFSSYRRGNGGHGKGDDFPELSQPADAKPGLETRSATPSPSSSLSRQMEPSSVTTMATKS